MSEKKPRRQRKKATYLGFRDGSDGSDEDDFESTPPSKKMRKPNAASVLPSESGDESTEACRSDESKSPKRDDGAEKKDSEAPDKEPLEKELGEKQQKKKAPAKSKSGDDEDFENFGSEDGGSDDSGSDFGGEGEDDFEEFTAPKKAAAKPKNKKPTTPKAEKSKGRGQSKQPKELNESPATKKAGRGGGKATKKPPSSASVSRPAVTVHRRPAWTPPTSSGSNKLGGVSVKSPAAPIRIGLSRNARVGKPLHPNAKSPI
eukprot:m.63475 g.63475  ORF g.63475 m.63475 type:complete len:260 (+) comp35171_c0_seq4:2678-3457(+)